MFYLDPIYLMIFIVTLVISGAAQWYVKSAYNKWSKVRNGSNLPGAQVGQRIIMRTGLGSNLETAGQGQLSGIRFESAPGQLTDHYDPRTNIVRLSQGVAMQPSVASMAIVAHELGHAQQDEHRSLLMAARNFLVPAIQVSPQIAYLCILVGLIFNFMGLFYLGVLFYGLMVLFTIVTLPVEFDASRRALVLLEQSGLMVTEEDRAGTRKVLTAAAMTYVAAAVTAVLQLLYYLSLGRRRS